MPFASATAPRCNATTRAGKPCVASAGKDSNFCFLHDPHKEKERNEGRKKGGKARQGRLNELLEGCLDPDIAKAKLVTYEQVRDLLEDTVHHVRTGKLTTDRANSISGLCRVILSAKDNGKLEDRLKDLETRTRVLKGVPPEQLLEIVKAHLQAKANGAPSEH